jgi:hypothetical protein
MAIKKLKHITTICKELYEEKGPSAVYGYVRDFLIRQPTPAIDYRDCTPCDANTPQYHGVCLICGTEAQPGLDGMYGNQLNTVGELRDAMSELSDEDQITLVAIDLETGDEQDHYPMHLDVIDNIRLTTGQVINEVQFVQERNAPPDTRDRQPIVDALIDVLAEDMAKGDTTVLDELLLRMPFNVLKYALPEDMWADFDNE